jgi:hypothetical protein
MVIDQRIVLRPFVAARYFNQNAVLTQGRRPCKAIGQ